MIIRRNVGPGKQSLDMFGLESHCRRANDGYLGDLGEFGRNNFDVGEKTACEMFNVKA